MSKQLAFFDFLRSKCPDIQQLIDILDVSSSQHEIRFQHIYKQYIAIKGHVQSGKTNFMLCTSLLMIWHGISMVIVTRNLQSDAKQLLSRWEELKQSASEYVKVKIVKSSTSKQNINGTALYICLGNNTSLERIRKLTSTSPFMICLDEVDLMDMGKNTCRQEQLTLLKHNSMCIYGISATMMDPLAKESILPKHIFLLKPTEDYKGIKDISFQPLHMPSSFISSIQGNILEENHDLMPFLQDFSKRIPQLYPIIGLVNVCRTIQPYLELQKHITEDIKGILTMVYHAKGITLGYEGKIEHRNETISELLSWLKHNGGVDRFPRIIIFSGDLAGRGLSFTDMEYEWHLHVLYLIVSSSTDEPELIQKIRLCGRYKHDVPLQLYTTTDTYRDLIKAYYRQEEIITSLCSKQESSEMECKKMIENMSLSKEKFTKRKMTKHIEFPIQKTSLPSESEWSMKIYQGKYPEENKCEAPLKEYLDKDEIKRLSQKMFPTWSNHIGITRISLWLDALVPEQIYSKKEMVDMCREFKITLQHLIVPKYQSGSNGYGKLLIVQNEKYQLHPELVDSHKKYFTHAD